MSETPEHVEAAKKRAAALKAPDRSRDYVDALLVERRGYVVRDLKDRVAQVDAELERVGYVDPDAKPAPRKSGK